MKTIKFSAHSKKGAMKFFTLCVEGTIQYPKTENPTKKEIIDCIKEKMAEEWTRGSYIFTPDDVMVKLGA